MSVLATRSMQGPPLETFLYNFCLCSVAYYQFAGSAHHSHSCPPTKYSVMMRYAFDMHKLLRQELCMGVGDLARMMKGSHGQSK